MKNDPKIISLFEHILKLETLEECTDFFDDLCTINEVNDMADRLEVAQLLIEGVTYEHIEAKTKMSSATISRINRCILHGNGGYRKVILKK